MAGKIQNQCFQSFVNRIIIDLRIREKQAKLFVKRGFFFFLLLISLCVLCDVFFTVQMQG